jgi:hypothetical protein
MPISRIASKVFGGIAAVPGVGSPDTESIVSELTIMSDRLSELKTAIASIPAENYWWTVGLPFLGTIILAAIALWGEDYKKAKFRSDLRPFPRAESAKQQKDLTVYRILLNNTKGRGSARQVRALVEDWTWENKEESYKDKVFVPLYLRWTHFNKPLRDIHQGEIAHLDIIDQMHTGGKDGPYARITASDRDLCRDMLTMIPPGENVLKIKLFPEDGQVRAMTVQFNYQHDEPLAITLIPK